MQLSTAAFICARSSGTESTLAKRGGLWVAAMASSMAVTVWAGTPASASAANQLSSVTARNCSFPVLLGGPFRHEDGLEAGLASVRSAIVHL